MKPLGELAKTFKIWREVSGLTLRDIESKTGVSNVVISQFENNRVETSYTTVRRLINFMIGKDDKKGDDV